MPVLCVKMMLAYATITFSGAIFSGCQHREIAELNRSSDESAKRNANLVKSHLDEAGTIEILSLDPIPDDPKLPPRLPALGLLKQYKIIGHSIVSKEADRKEIRDALLEGFSQPVFGAGCFLPRHALRFQAKGQNIVIIICYHCANGEISISDDTGRFSISGFGEDALDKIFARYGLPKADFESVMKLSDDDRSP